MRKLFSGPSKRDALSLEHKVQKILYDECSCEGKGNARPGVTINIIKRKKAVSIRPPCKMLLKKDLLRKKCQEKKRCSGSVITNTKSVPKKPVKLVKVERSKSCNEAYRASRS
jgi:hypothetical protein